MFAKNLKKAMARNEMPPYELCRITGIAKSSMSGYLSGISEPRSDKIKLIAKALNVTPEELTAKSDDEVEIPEEMPVRVPTKVAAKLLGMTAPCVVAGIRNGTLPIGYMYGRGSKRGSVYISPYKLQEAIGVTIWDNDGCLIREKAEKLLEMKEEPRTTEQSNGSTKKYTNIIIPQNQENARGVNENE